jgi:NAD(P)H dehydrogenase (quinone)
VIVVSAATGELGRLVVDDLLHRVPPDQVAVAVRSPAKAAQLAAAGVAVRSADYTNPGSLRTAFAGADRLLFISSSDVESGTRVHHAPQRRRRRRRGWVGAIAYTRGLGADVVDESVPVLGDHHVTERLLRDSGLAHTILRNPIYSDFSSTRSYRRRSRRGR